MTMMVCNDLMCTYKLSLAHNAKVTTDMPEKNEKQPESHYALPITELKMGITDNVFISTLLSELFVGTPSRPASPISKY